MPTTVMPGFTHLQIAQPVTFGHHLMAYVEMLGRDRGRLADCRRRLNECPLGAAALAGTSFPIDRHADRRRARLRPAGGEFARRRLRPRFRDRVSGRRRHRRHASVAPRRGDRDLVRATRSASSALSDAFTTGSSIMPQKRNPDAAELVRAKTGRLNGALVALLTVMKGLPLAYGKDMQEDKVPVFEAADALELCLAATAGMVRDMQPDRERLRAAAERGFSTATDLADWLVRELGLPFRQRPSRHRRDRQARRGAAAARWPSCRSPRCRRSSRRSPRRVYEVLDGRALGREPRQFRRHRAVPGPRGSRSRPGEVSWSDRKPVADPAPRRLGSRSAGSAR